MQKFNFKLLQNTSLLIALSFCMTVNASINASEVKDVLLQKYMINYSDKNQIAELKAETLKHGGQSVEALIEVSTRIKIVGSLLFYLGKSWERNQLLFWLNF
jgi:hypothetical protein